MWPIPNSAFGLNSSILLKFTYQDRQEIAGMKRNWLIQLICVRPADFGDNDGLCEAVSAWRNHPQNRCWSLTATASFAVDGSGAGNA
jgi:hypothetical protein